MKLLNNQNNNTISIILFQKEVVHYSHYVYIILFQVVRSAIHESNLRLNIMMGNLLMNWNYYFLQVKTINMMNP